MITTLSAASGNEAELALDSIVVLEVNVGQAELAGVAFVLRGLAHIGRGAGNGGEDGLAQGGDVPGGSLIRCHDRFHQVADLQCALTFVDGEMDGSALYSHDFSHELREIRYRAAELACPDIEQCFLLLRCRFVIDDHGYLPVSLQNVAGNVDHESEA